MNLEKMNYSGLSISTFVVVCFSVCTVSMLFGGNLGELYGIMVAMTVALALVNTLYLTIRVEPCQYKQTLQIFYTIVLGFYAQLIVLDAIWYIA